MVKKLKYAILIFICIVITVSISGPTGTTDKPILKGEVREWYMYGKLISREQKVIFPDGTSCWIKSKEAVSPTNKEWLAKANTIWEAKQQEPEPKICPTCGQFYYP